MRGVLNHVSGYPGKQSEMMGTSLLMFIVTRNQRGPQRAYDEEPLRLRTTSESHQPTKVAANLARSLLILKGHVGQRYPRLHGPKL